MTTASASRRRAGGLSHPVGDLGEGGPGAFLVELAARRAADTNPADDMLSPAMG